MSLLNSIEQENKVEAELSLSYNFCFETLDEKSQVNKTIYGSNPDRIFTSLEELEEFVGVNYSKYKDTNAGIAGYIGYEGDLEFAFYKDIYVSDQQVRNSSNGLEDFWSKNSFCIKEADPLEFIDAVKKCQQYIKEGDIYQANLTRKFLVDIVKENSDIKKENNFDCLLGEAIYQKLCKSNPAAYAGYMNFAKYQIISSSPESFLKFYNDKDKTGARYISTSPIKGTAEINKLNFLRASEKDHAEHIMIVDLERNDLGRLCKTGTISVEELMGIHKFNNLYHYISTIAGELKEELYADGLKFNKIFAALFPSGSITGAPKIRAMEIIRELESSPRGPYTGTMGYWKFNGEGEFNILIRSIVVDKQSREISFHAGGGITASSIPEEELKETNLKAQKLKDIFI